MHKDFTKAPVFQLDPMKNFRLQDVRREPIVRNRRLDVMRRLILKSDRRQNVRFAIVTVTSEINVIQTSEIFVLQTS